MHADADGWFGLFVIEKNRFLHKKTVFFGILSFFPFFLCFPHKQRKKQFFGSKNRFLKSAAGIKRALGTTLGIKIKKLIKNKQNGGQMTFELMPLIFL